MIPIISIIIVSYNSEKYIASCLDSILAQDAKNYEIVVIDNASQDKTAAFIKSKYPECLLIENRANYGVCRARNQGIAIARGEFILCLDHDVILEENFISESYHAIKGREGIGAIAPKILLADKNTIYSTGIHISFLRRFYDLGRGRKNNKEFGRQRYVFGASAAAALYRREALEEIKEGREYFDQEFFYFFEDVDLSWRMQRKGWKVLYCPQALCFHQGGRSRKKDGISQFFCFRNRYWTLIKNEDFFGFLRFAAVFFIYDLWRNLAMLAANPAYFIKASREIIKFLPKMARKQAYSSKKASFFLKSFFLFRKQILILFLLTLFSSNFFLAGPYISKLFIDQAVLGGDTGKFLALSVIGGSVFLFSILIKLIADIAKNRIAVKLKLNLAGKFIRKFYSLDLSFLQAKSTGENIYRFSDTDRIADFILEHLPSLLVDIFKIPVMLGISLWISPRMTVLLFILSPLFLLHSLYIRNKLKLIYEELWQRSALVSKELYQGFSKVFIIKAYGWEAYQRHKLLRSLLKNIRLKIKSFRWVVLTTVISSFLSKAIYGLVSLYGGWLIIKGKLTLGSYTAVLLYLVQLGGIFESLGYKFEYFSQEMVSLKKFFEIMDIQPLIKDMADVKDLLCFKGEIRFQDVCFRYGKGREIFKGLNFTIPACSWIGIAGPSGCGKTSLINLILRLYEPQQGEIFLDGLNLKGISLASLRGRIGIATQQPFLFDLSIRENIGYGLKNVTQDEIEHAAEASCIHDFIRELPCGYDTIIGEDGCYLSQGLKQRIAIARGILRKPHLLILDEATSSLDSPTEEKVFRNLKKLRDGLSTIIISHRLFSIKDCQRIYFLTDGLRVQEGTHAELLSNPSYRDFFYE